MNKLFNKISALVLAIALILPSIPALAEEDGPMTLSNSYLEYSLNKHTGAFMIRTLEGHPQKALDNNIPLLYDGSWQTSYTTVRIDGEDYVFGKEYGFLGLSSSLSAPVLDPYNQTLSITWTIKDIEITQTAQLATDPNNPLCGNVGLRYDVKNISGQAADVGIRILLDNALGQNDAPNVIAEGEELPVLYEREYTSTQSATLPSQIRYIDSVERPGVMAYAIINSWDDKIIPNRVIVGHWANIANSKWDYTPNGGLRFVSSSSSMKTADTASAFYYDPVEMSAGSERTLDLLYGIGDFTKQNPQSNVNVAIQIDDRPALNENKDGYVNDGEFSVTVKIDNSIDNAQILSNAIIYLGYEGDKLEVIESPDENSNIAKGIGTIDVGNVLTYTWRFKAKPQTHYVSSAFIATLSSSLENVAFREFIVLPSVKGNLPEFTVDSIAPAEVYFTGTKMITIKGKYSSSTLKPALGSQWGVYLENVNTQTVYHYKAENISFIGENEDTLCLTYPDELPLGSYKIGVQFTGGLSELFGGETGRIELAERLLVSNNPELITKRYGLLAVVRHGMSYSIHTFESEEQFEAFAVGNGTDSEGLQFGNLRQKETPINEIMLEIRGSVKYFDDGNISYYYADPREDLVNINNIIYYGNSSDMLLIMEIPSDTGNEDEKSVKVSGNGDLSIIGGMTFFKWGFEINLEFGNVHTHNSEKVEGGSYPGEIVEDIVIDYTGAAGIIQNIAGFLFELKYGVLSEYWSALTGENEGYTISFGGKIGLNFFKMPDLGGGGEEEPTPAKTPPSPPATGLDERKRDTSGEKSLEGLGFSADINDILFGQQEDGGVGFKGLDTTISVGLPTDYMGESITTGPSFEFTISTIRNIYEIKGGVGLYMFECEGLLTIKLFDVCPGDRSIYFPFVDAIEFGIETDLGVPIIPPYLSITMLKGGITDVYDSMMGNYSGVLPPITLKAGLGVELLELLNAQGEAHISPRNFGVDLTFSLANYPAITLEGILEAQWADPFFGTLIGQVIIQGCIIAGASVHIEDGLIKGSLFGKLLVPSNVPIVAGEEIANAEGYISNLSVGLLGKTLGVNVGVVYYWGDGDITIISDGPSMAAASAFPAGRGVSAPKAEPELMMSNNISLLPVSTAQVSSRSLLGAAPVGMPSFSPTTDVSFNVLGEYQNYEALLVEIPISGVDKLEASDIAINDGAIPVVSDDGNGGGNFMVRGEEPNKKLIISLQKSEFEHESQIKISLPPACAAYSAAIRVCGVSAIASISSATTSFSAPDKLTYTTDVKNISANSELNVYLTTDINALGDKIELGTPINKAPLTGADIANGTLDIPDTLPSGTYYVIYTLTTEGQGANAYIDTAGPLVWDNSNEPARLTSAELEPMGNGVFKVNLEGLDSDCTDVFVEMKQDDGTPVLGYELLKFSKDRANEIYIGSDRDLALQLPTGQDGAMEDHAIPPLNAGAQYYVTVTPVKTVSGFESGKYTTKSYFGEATDSAKVVMPPINKPVLEDMRVEGITEKDGVNYLNRHNLYITYSFDTEVQLSLDINGKVYSYTDEYAKEWSIDLPIDDGDYVIMYKAKNAAGDTSGSDATSGAGVYTFIKDTTPPVLFVDGATTIMATSESISVNGVCEDGAYVTVNDIPVGEVSNGKFAANLSFDLAKMSERYIVKAVDAAGNDNYIQLTAINDTIKGIEDIRITGDIEVSTSEGRESIALPLDGVLNLKAEGIYTVDGVEKSIDLTDEADWSIIANEDLANIDASARVTPLDKGSIVVKASLSGATYIDKDGNESYGALEDVVYVTIGEAPVAPSPRPHGSGGSASQPANKLDATLKELIKALGSENIIKTIDIFPTRQTSVGATQTLTVVVPIGSSEGENKIVMHKKIENPHTEALAEGDKAVGEQFAFERVLDTPLKKPIVLTLDYSEMDVDAQKIGLYRYNSYFDKWELIKESGNDKERGIITCAIHDLTGQFMFMERNDVREFSDVDISSWSAGYIYGLSSLDVIFGMQEGPLWLFKPQDLATRAEFLALLMRMLKIDVMGYSDTALPFADVADIPEWALPYFKAAYALGIMNGMEMPEGLMAGADAQILRMDAFKLLYSAVSFEAEESGEEFVDFMKLPDYAREPISKLRQKGVINGYEDGEIRGENSISREEIATILVRWMNLVLND